MGEGTEKVGGHGRGESWMRESHVIIQVSGHWSLATTLIGEGLEVSNL